MGFTSEKTSADDARLKAAVADALRLCERHHAPRFLGFFDERQRVLAEQVLRHERASRFLFYGGYTEAERTLLGFFPEETDESASSWFPVTALAFRYRTGVSLNHRDFLGALMNCGVKRDKLGDILCGDGLAVVFAEDTIARFLEGQITRIGNEGVTVLTGYQGDLPLSRSFSEIRDTVALPRLDAVVKVAAGLSREEAARRIEAGLVSVNHRPCLAVSSSVKEGDVLSVRGVGRFRLAALGPETRKGRLFITLQKYQ